MGLVYIYDKPFRQMTRATSLLLLLFLVCFFRSAGQPANPANGTKYDWFTFDWEGYTVAGQHFDKAAILVPVKLNDLKGYQVAQFDLGSNATILYGNTIKNYFGSGAALLALTDTTTKEMHDGVVSYTIKGINVAIGKTILRRVILYDEFGDDNPTDSLYTSSPKLIGTIGADIAEGKILIIDYPRQRMCLLDTLDDYWTGRTTFVEARLQNSRIHIPITVNGQTYWFLLDTGASLFPLSSDQNTWAKLTGAARPTDSLLIPTWGTKAMVYGAPAKQDIFLGSLKLTRGKVWYSYFKPWLDLYRQAGVSGTAGNTFFFNDVIVIDFKHHRFGVVKETK